jgi:membrane protease YdiL (CAAX protease family)
MDAAKAAVLHLEATAIPNTRRRDLLELSFGYGLILLVIWTPRPLQRLLYCAASIFLAVITWISFHSSQAMGLRVKNLLRSLWIVALSLVLSALAFALAIHFDTVHDINGTVAFIQRYWGYALWSFAQQILLQDFVLQRLLRLLKSRRAAVLIAAALFALAHLPNPILTPLTLVWGFIACALFLRYRNLYPLAFAHALLGITLATTIPVHIIRNLRVGLGYLTYSRPIHHRNHWDQTVSTHAWVSAEAPTRRS